MNPNTADLPEPGCLQGRRSAYSSNHEEKHFVALGTWAQILPEESLRCELQAAHVSISVKCCCLQKALESGLHLCLSGLGTLVTQL